MERTFKRLSDHEIVDTTQYIKEYVQKYPETQLLIGTDSQNHKRETVYAIVIALYRPGKGAHALYSRFREVRYYNGKPGEVEKQRLLNEVWYSVQVAEEVKKELGLTFKYIDIDINPDKKYGSNIALAEAVGLVVGMGYEVRYKKCKENAMITYCCDQLVK